jgi:hypothetical protein
MVKSGGNTRPPIVCHGLSKYRLKLQLPALIHGVGLADKGNARRSPETSFEAFAFDQRSNNEEGGDTRRKK